MIVTLAISKESKDIAYVQGSLFWQELGTLCVNVPSSLQATINQSIVFMLGKALDCWFYWKWACHAKALIPIKSTTLGFTIHILTIRITYVQKLSKYLVDSWLLNFDHFFLLWHCKVVGCQLPTKLFKVHLSNYLKLHK
jgi:hypothetical protein